MTTFSSSFLKGKVSPVRSTCCVSVARSLQNRGFWIRSSSVRWHNGNADKTEGRQRYKELHNVQNTPYGHLSITPIYSGGTSYLRTVIIAFTNLGRLSTRFFWRILGNLVLHNSAPRACGKTTCLCDGPMSNPLAIQRINNCI